MSGSNKIITDESLLFKFLADESEFAHLVKNANSFIHSSKE